MKGKKEGFVELPPFIRLDVSSLCQLKCPLCQGARDDPENIVGRGYLKFHTFKSFVDQNPHIRWMELASSGEVFLNPDLPEILAYAFADRITTTVNEGANLNHASDEALEGMVKFGTAVLRCSIDGVTQETYAKYRKGGKLTAVISNIQKINAFKKRYQSSTPRLIFQFTVFGHNEHEMELAVVMARMLNMKLEFRYNCQPDFMPVINRSYVEKIMGAADRDSYLAQTGRDFYRGVCYALWKSPQINWDGKLLGCSDNRRTVFSPSVFKGDLAAHVNEEKIRHTRLVLMGKAPPDRNTPCVNCRMYQALKHYNNWITSSEIANWIPPHERTAPLNLF